MMHTIKRNLLSLWGKITIFRAKKVGINTLIHTYTVWLLEEMRQNGTFYDFISQIKVKVQQ